MDELIEIDVPLVVKRFGPLGELWLALIALALFDTIHV